MSIWCRGRCSTLLRIHGARGFLLRRVGSLGTGSSEICSVRPESSRSSTSRKELELGTQAMDWESLSVTTITMASKTSTSQAEDGIRYYKVTVVQTCAFFQS